MCSFFLALQCLVWKLGVLRAPELNGVGNHNDYKPVVFPSGRPRCLHMALAAAYGQLGETPVRLA